MQRKQLTYCRYAPSLGALEGTPQEVWGTPKYRWWLHRKKPCVFFGMYDLRDYLAVAFHRGKKYILWAGSDINNLFHGFLLNDGKLAILSILTKGLFSSFIKLFLKSAIHYTENDVEAKKLAYCLSPVGIRLKDIMVVPSYMGQITDIKPCYKHESKLNVYSCCPEGREVEYGFLTIERIAKKLPQVNFHLYGSNSWKTKNPNVILHGRVPKKQMNEEIAEMQVALRLNNFDGFSEIVAKGILMGHHVINKIDYLGLIYVKNDEDIIEELENLKLFGDKGLNLNTREYYLSLINDYPWNNNI
jgi:hypothetical protein